MLLTTSSASQGVLTQKQQGKPKGKSKIREKIDKSISRPTESLELPVNPTLPKFQLPTRNKQLISPHQRYRLSMKSLTVARGPFYLCVKYPN